MNGRASFKKDEDLRNSNIINLKTNLRPKTAVMRNSLVSQQSTNYGSKYVQSPVTPLTNSKGISLERKSQILERG